MAWERVPAEIGVTGEASQLLQQLTKLRQECSHVQRFNCLLHEAVEKRRNEQQELAELARARCMLKETISQRLSHYEAARWASTLSKALRLWRLRALRSQHVLAEMVQDQQSAFLKRRLRSWRLACYHSFIEGGLKDGLRERNKLIEGVQAQIDNANQQLKRDCLHSRTKGMSLLHDSERLQTCRQAFAFWAAVAAMEIERGSHMKLHVLFNRSTVEGFFRVWAAFCKRQSFASAHGPCGRVETISERVLLAASSRLRVMFVLWRMAAELEAVASKAMPKDLAEVTILQARACRAVRSQLLLRTALQHLQCLERYLLASSLRTWRFATECEASLAFVREQQQVEFVHRRRLVAEQLSSAWKAAAERQLIHRFWGSWAACPTLALKHHRAEAQAARLSLKKQASESARRLQDLQNAAGAVAGTIHLSSACRRTMRTAWSTFRRNSGCREAGSDVFDRLQAVRASCAGLVSQRRHMEDWFVRQHHSMLAARQAAREVASAWAFYCTLKLFRAVLVSWRISALTAAFKRERQWQDLQRKAEVQEEMSTDSALERQRAAQSKAAQVLFNSLNEGSLLLVFQRWHRLAFKEKRHKQVVLLRQASEDKLEARRRRQSQAELTTARYREQAFSFMASGSVGSPNWMRLFLWDWKRAITSSTSKRILRLWRAIAAMEIFKCKGWLLEFCLHVWAAATLSSMIEAESSKTLSKRHEVRKKEQLHQTLWKRLEEGRSRCLLHNALCAWQRGHQAELLRGQVKVVCEQWNDEEEAASLLHRRIVWHASSLRSWTYRSISTLQNFEDLRDAFLAWAQEGLFAKAEAPLEEASNEVQTGPEAQQRLESLVRDSWMERSLRANSRQRQNGDIAQLLVAWRAAAHEIRVSRTRHRRKRRGHAIEQRQTSEWQKCTKRLVLDNWQTVLCTNRRLWLENRCRWLRTAIEAVQPESPHQANEADLQALQCTLQSNFVGNLQKLTFGNPRS